MRPSLHLLGLALLAACGGRTGLSTPDAGGGTALDGAGAAGDAAVAPLRCSVGVQPSARDPREVVDGALCRFDGRATRPGAIVLAAIEGDALYGIDGRGAVRRLHRFAEGLPFAAEPGRAVLTARGEYIAGAMMWIESLASGRGRVAFERVLARRDGAVLHRALEVLPYFTGGNELSVHGNECGVFAWGWGAGLRQRMDLATPDGALIEPVEGYLLRADPDGDGVLAVTEVGGPDRVWWLDPRARSFTPASYESGRFRSSLHSLGADLVYATGWLDGTVTLERPGGAVQRFPSEQLRGVDEARITATARNGWVFAPGRGGDHAVINVRSGERRRVAFAVPPGMRRVHLPGAEPGPDDPWGISITTEGDLLLALRDNTFGRVHRSRDGSSWSAYEPAFGDVSSVRVMEHNGTVLAFAFGLRGNPTDWWRPLEGAARRYDGRNAFVTRGEGRSLPRSPRTLEGETYHLSDDGGCLAYWTASGPAALRVTAGSPREFVLDAAATEPRLARAMTWALGDGAVLSAPPE